MMEASHVQSRTSAARRAYDRVARLMQAASLHVTDMQMNSSHCCGAGWPRRKSACCHRGSVQVRRRCEETDICCVRFPVSCGRLHAAPRRQDHRHRLDWVSTPRRPPPVVRKAQPLIEKVWRHCEDKGSRGRTVKLRGRFNDLEIITRSRTGRVPISSRCELETCRSSSFKRDTRSKADPPSCLHARANRRPSCSSAYQFESASIRIKTAVHQ